jgi:hypothetical protein
MADGQTKRQRKAQGALANKRLAELRAPALASTTSELWSGGFVSISTIASESKRRRVPTVRGKMASNKRQLAARPPGELSGFYQLFERNVNGGTLSLRVMICL